MVEVIEQGLKVFADNRLFDEGIKLIGSLLERSVAQKAKNIF